MLECYHVLDTLEQFTSSKSTRQELCFSGFIEIDLPKVILDKRQNWADFWFPNLHEPLKTAFLHEQSVHSLNQIPCQAHRLRFWKRGPETSIFRIFLRSIFHARRLVVPLPIASWKAEWSRVFRDLLGAKHWIKLLTFLHTWQQKIISFPLKPQCHQVHLWPWEKASEIT